MRGVVFCCIAIAAAARAQTPTLFVTRGALQFSAVAGTSPASQAVFLSASGGARLPYQAVVGYANDSGADWLQVTPRTGFSDSMLVVSIGNTAGMERGRYQAVIRLFVPGTAALTRIDVSLTVASAVLPDPVSPGSMSFRFWEGDPGSSTFLLPPATNSVWTQRATATTESGEPWLTTWPVPMLSPSGEIGFLVGAGSGSLPAGTYRGNVLLSEGTNVPVTMTIRPRGDPNPASVQLNAAVGQRGVASRTFTYRPRTVSEYVTSIVRTNSGGSWLSVSPASGMVAREGFVTVLANPEGLAAGDYSGEVSLWAATADAPYKVAVNLRVGLGANAPGLRFVPVEPCRLLETRAEYNFHGRTGALGPPFLVAGETRVMRPRDSTVCRIPATAKAYSVNVTVLAKGNAGAMASLYAAGEPAPDFFPIRTGQTEAVANAAIVKAGSAGAVAVSVTEAADVLLDVNGYFTEDTSGLAFYPVAPCRVVDTRAAYRQPAGPFGPPTLGAGERRTFAMRASPDCRIPANAQAYAVSLTAVPDGPLAFLSLLPAGGVSPVVSSLNAASGRVASNQVIVPAGANGAIDAYSFGRTDLVMDVTGYFAPDDGQTGLLYYPVAPCRVGEVTFGDEESKMITIPGMAGCHWYGPPAKAYALNVSALPGGVPMPFLTAYPSGSGRPGTSFLNAFEGQMVTNSVLVPAGNGGAIDVYAYRRTRAIVEMAGYFAR